MTANKCMWCDEYGGVDKLPIGCPIGRNDRHGNPVHVGDTLDFDEREWGEPMRFVVELEDGQIMCPGAPSDISNWCTLVRKWNGESFTVSGSNELGAKTAEVHEEKQ